MIYRGEYPDGTDDVPFLLDQTGFGAKRAGNLLNEA